MVAMVAGRALQTGEQCIAAAYSHRPPQGVQARTCTQLWWPREMGDKQHTERSLYGLCVKTVLISYSQLFFTHDHCNRAVPGVHTGFFLGWRTGSTATVRTWLFGFDPASVNPDSIRIQSRFNPDSIQIQSGFNPDSIQIQSRFNPDSIRI